ncbi:uncharacterized protein LOC122397173 [Colletes gigas]|uniref:uncharacterized protein LOC122397173 n=1 Tax=Colletes gigas TaxID=935657 RepID=UPI001C9A9672|nr:uncharacterized protein LOC122397173 [Colletes gigas]XP_043252067.1 uncharacterized protein LOC122397173 [Colletes gigas]XP_043252069.1 uncharacterized protein LOC122397173 [Colletes gigas]
MYGKSHRRAKKDKIKEDEKNEEYLEDIIDIEENVTKDFEFLINTPIIEDNFLVLKSDESWNTDVSRYMEYFMIDLAVLSAVVESVPFNENVKIDNKYFTNDQLTNIYNKAKLGKENYNKILSRLEEQVITDRKDLEESQGSVEDVCEDLDFLLSLETPADEASTSRKSLGVSHNADKKITAKSGASVKSMDLEKWLDSILDD